MLPRIVQRPKAFPFDAVEIGLIAAAVLVLAAVALVF